MPHNITIVPLPPKCPELNPQENVWQFIRDNWLSNRVFENADAILDHCCDAWNKLEAQPWTIMSLGMRDWAHRFRSVRIGISAGHKRPQISIPREADYFHLAVSPRARPFGDTPRAGILWKYGRDRIRPPQNVARVVANATCRFCRETLAPDGGIERVAKLIFEC